MFLKEKRFLVKILPNKGNQFGFLSFLAIFVPKNKTMAKEQLITIARDLLIDLGIKSVTMDDIAQKAGVSKKRSTITLRIKPTLSKQ